MQYPSNLDEEAADLMRLQQAYQAASQIIATADTLFNPSWPRPADELPHLHRHDVPAVDPTMLAPSRRSWRTRSNSWPAASALVTAKDDPVAAGTAVGLDRAVAELERFGMNASGAEPIGPAGERADQVGDAMARVNELVIQANNAAMGEDQPQGDQHQLKAIYAGLLDLANSTDGAGRYLFGGTSDGSAPFAIAGGSVIYSGDQTQRQVEVAPDMFVADTLPGSEVFLRLRTGDGRIDGQPAAGNTGTGLLMGFGVTDSTAWDGGTYTLSFGAGDTYQVTDAGGTVVTTGTYARRGHRLRGRADADRRTAGQRRQLHPRSGRLARHLRYRAGLITTLDTNPTTDAQRAAMQNDLQAAMRDVTTAQSKMIDARASRGAQLSAIDDAAALRKPTTSPCKGTLSTLRDLDWAEAIGRYQMENTALQAARAVFMQMQSLSLFQKRGLTAPPPFHAVLPLTPAMPSRRFFELSVGAA